MTSIGDEYDNDWNGNDGAEGDTGADDYFAEVESVEEAAPETPEAPVLEAAVAPALSAEDEELLHEIEKAQKKPAGPVKLILTVLISGVVFVAVGTAWWSWELALGLVPILLIHEFGHFVTMKSFDYRNVNMFFIPFLGAGVTGQRFNVPAWKKAMVALMGPLPSILLATGVGIAAVVLELDGLVYFSIIALFLNGFNLVPFPPLDGGLVMQAVLFCRHYYLDAALRIIAVVILFGLSVLQGGSAISMGMAGFLLITIPITLRNGKVAQQLKSEGNLDPVTEEDRIPPATALRIAAALRARMKTKVATKGLAQFTVQVYEQLHTRPPGILASMGLLFMHGAGMLFAFLACVGLGLAVNEEMREAFLDGMDAGLQPPPLYAYDCEAEETPGDQYKPARGGKSVIATFATFEEANAAYKAAIPDMTPQDHLQWFGRSVSILLDRKAKPIALQPWIDRWEADAAELLVDTGYNQVFFSLDATFPDTELTGRVEKELRAFLENWYSYSLNPPWQPDVLVRDPAEGAHYKARMSLVEIVEVSAEADYENERTAAAQRIGDYAELQKANDEIRREAVAEFMASDPDIDQVIVDLYLRSQIGGDEYDEEALRQLIERMGGTFVPYEEEGDEPEADQKVDEDDRETVAVDDGMSGNRKIENKDGNGNAAEQAVGDIDDEEGYYALDKNYERYGGGGSVIRSLNTVVLRGVRFTVTAEGAKAMADWLCMLGAHDITYAFYQYEE